MIDYRLPLMAGIDIPIDELQVVIHPPKIKEISYIGETEFFQGLQFLSLKKEAFIKDETLLSSVTNFQVLMKVLEQSNDKDKKKSITMLLKLLFPQFSPMITKNSIILANSETKENILLDNDNFETFQEVIRQVLCVNNIFQGNNIVYNPGNAKAKEIADKLMRGRRKVAELKSNGKSESVFTRYISILTVGISGMTVEDCLNLNLFQMFDLMERYNSYIEWNTDLRVRLAGGKPDKPVESWMRDMHP